MTQKLQSIAFEQAANDLPQASNCINYFRKKILNTFSEDLNNRVWVAGGCVRDYFDTGKVTKDIDFFAVDRKSMADLVKELRKHYSFKHYLLTKNAIKGYAEVNGKRVDIDIVKKPFPNPLACIDAFDFTVCCFAVSFNQFYFHQSAIFDLIKKKLVVHNLPAPVDSLKRMNKYTQRGFVACNGTILTIAKAINELNPQNTDLFEFYKFD